MATKKQSLTVPVADNPKQDCHCGCAPCDGTCCRLDCLVQPRFFCGQLLTDADLSALLKWSRDRFGLSRYRHGWGVVCGLDVRGKFGSLTTVTVTPGYAVDCCGNDVIVCEDASLDLKRYCRDEEDPCADLWPQLRRENREALQQRDQLRAVDIYLQYNEESADPATAMGRGSCKQVSPCEYSRTKETYKLVPKVAVAGTDPVAARATRWHEEYEKCLDVLKNFRGQFGSGGDARAKGQWLLRWLAEHPQYGLTALYQKLARLLEENEGEFFNSEQNLVAVLFAFVQVCRNAYLNCECFGCDEDVRLPLARVWMSPEDRTTTPRRECQIVAIDAYPPYRRPIQPECWPSPLGSVNVGRFIWHRWEEVCPAVRDLGLNVERTPFILPASLLDLEKLLSCDLFVRCGERRFAYVLDTKELDIDILGERVIGFCTTPPTGPAPPPPPPPPKVECPKIVIDNQQVVFTGQPITFTASLNPPDPNLDLRYNWRVSNGTITSGQDGPRIAIEDQRLIGSVEATVVISGLPANCPNKATAVTEIRVQDQPQPIVERPGDQSEVEDDFTQIPQIGNARAATLKNAGILSFKQLASTPVEKLKELFANDIGVTEDLLNEWLLGAKRLAG
jgi:predicted flap endonuclease-1-like 5' DNA nuclease